MIVRTGNAALHPRPLPFPTSPTPPGWCKPKEDAHGYPPKRAAAAHHHLVRSRSPVERVSGSHWSSALLLCSVVIVTVLGVGMTTSGLVT